MPPNQASRSIFKRYGDATFLFVTAFVLRAFTATIGAPFSYHSDEHWIFAPAFKMVKGNSWDLDWFRVPPLLIMMYREVISGLQAISPVDLTLPPQSWFDPLSIMPYQFALLFAGRLLVSFFSSVSVVFIYLILKRLISRRLSFILSFVYAWTTGVLFYSSFLRPEAMVIFFLLAAVYLFLIYEEHKKLVYMALAGASFGLACASKYNATFFILSIFLYFFLTHKNWKVTRKSLVTFFLGSFFVFVGSVPHFFWKFSAVAAEISQDYNYYSAGDLAFHNSKIDNFFYYLFCLYRFEGIFLMFWVFLLTLIGGVVVFKKLSFESRNIMIVSCFFCVSYIFFLSQFSYTAERNLTFVYPFIFISVGIFLNQCLLYPTKWIKVTTIGLISCIGISSIFFSGCFLSKIHKELPQDHVVSWINQNARSKSMIIREIETPLIDPHQFSVLYYPNIATIKPESLLELNPDYIVLSQFIYRLKNDFRNRYPKEFVEWIWSKSPDFEDNNPDQLPLGGSFRIYDFQKVKSEYINKFVAKADSNSK